MDVFSQEQISRAKLETTDRAYGLLFEAGTLSTLVLGVVGLATLNAALIAAAIGTGTLEAAAMRALARKVTALKIAHKDDQHAVTEYRKHRS